MQHPRYGLPLLLILLSAFFACAREKSAQGEKFGAASIRGEWYEFTGLRSGEIILPAANAAKLTASDSLGNPLYPSSEIVQWVRDTANISLTKEHGFALRFTVPEIKEDDYVIITAEIKPPAPIAMGKNPTRVIQGSFRYDARNSGHTEYIWYLPEGEILSEKYKGEWKITLNADNIPLLTKSFILK